MGEGMCWAEWERLQSEVSRGAVREGSECEGKKGCYYIEM